jgi:pyruvate/2-oxoglutarate dehydrogenase complex dihydrolipoamide acyltransferase (E2) component
MRSRVELPDLGCSHPRLSVWYARVGDRVLAGERLVEILVDGATVDLPCPAGGRLLECHARIDDPLSPGQLLAVIGSDETS